MQKIRVLMSPSEPRLRPELVPDHHTCVIYCCILLSVTSSSIREYEETRRVECRVVSCATH